MAGEDGINIRKGDAMTIEKKKKIKAIIIITLSMFLLGLGIWFAVIIQPQRRPKGTRYKTTKILKNKGDVKMIAHRGASGLTLENTVAAFEEAGKRSYYGIETDVHVTKDGKYIIVHDDSLKRIAGLDMVIEETDYETLRALRFKDVYGESDEENMYLPSLEEYLEICKKYDKQAILELKNKMDEQDAIGIAQAVKESGWFERTTFISFAGENLLAIRKVFPDADAQFLLEEVTDADIQFMIENRLDLDVCWDQVTRKLVKRMHDAGLKVNCWTVDGIECAKVMKWCKVDYITSNILE